MLEGFHPSVSDLLATTVLAKTWQKPLPSDIKFYPLEDVAQGVLVFQLPLFRGSALIAFFVEYSDYPVVFSLLQKNAESMNISEDEIADAQNLLYDCQVNVDRTMPKLRE